MKPGLTEYKLAKALSVVLAVILVLLPFHALFTTWLGSNFGHYDIFKVWKEIILIIIFPLAVWLALKNPELKKWFMKSQLLWLIRFYFLLTVALGIWSYAADKVNAEALVYALIINLRFLLFFVVCCIVAANYDFIRKNWQKILLIPAAIVVLFGLVQLTLPANFLTHFGYGPDTIPAVQTVDNDINNRRVQSTLRGANPLGAYLLLIITAMFALFSKPSYFRSLGLAVAFLALFYSYSRSAWIGVIVSVGLLIWWAYGQKNRLKWAAIAGLCLAAVASGILLLLRTSEEAQDALLHTSNKTPGSALTSNEARAEAIKNAAVDVAENPLGQGPGTAGPASVRNDQPPKIAENYYLQIGQEAGVIGMALFIAINIYVGWELWRRRDDVLAKILLASLVGLTAVNMLSHAWTDDTISYIFWGLTGIALAPAILEAKNKRNGKKVK